jgi:beta-ribofuranosylaminobenzene 5'-phosphate synthase
MSVRVVAPCRLHFGLFHVPVDGLTHHPDGRPVRKFGGLGLMIDEPCVTVTATQEREDSASGSLADRAVSFMDQSRDARPEAHPCWIKADGPTEHTGLGIGTALGLAVASIYEPFYWDAAEHRDGYQGFRARDILAPMVGRGARSGIGVEGFETGGFVIDDGKLGSDPSIRSATRGDFPPAWRVVLVRPPVSPVWYGDRERGAFARTRPADRALSLTEQLRALAYDTILPAVRNTDFDTFATSIAGFNRMAGEPFAHDQGGPYAGAEVACVIDELIDLGAAGVGQSSWGPTVFAFCESETDAEKLAGRARERFSSATEVTITLANNTGARVENL